MGAITPFYAHGCSGFFSERLGVCFLERRETIKWNTINWPILLKKKTAKGSENETNGLIFSERVSEVGLGEINVIYRHWMTLNTDDGDEEELLFLWSCTDVSTLLWTLWFSLCQMCVLHISMGKYYTCTAWKYVHIKCHKNYIKMWLKNKNGLCFFFPAKCQELLLFAQNH